MKTISSRPVFALLCTVLFALSFSVASAIPQRPDPPRLVNDIAGLFSQSQVNELEGRLVAFNDTTSTQILVLTVNDLEGMDSFTYAVEVGETWGVGSQKFDNGVVILVKPKTANESGDVFIAVGYGLEGAIPDAYAKRIINEIMIPEFKQNDYFGAVSKACDKIIALASGEGFSNSSEEDDDSIWSMLFVLVLFIGLYIWYSRKAKNGGTGGDGSSGGTTGRSTTWIPTYTGRSNSSRGGGFGGFGGGSFGGGGAGGKW